MRKTLSIILITLFFSVIVVSCSPEVIPGSNQPTPNEKEENSPTNQEPSVSNQEEPPESGARPAAPAEDEPTPSKTVEAEIPSDIEDPVQPPSVELPGEASSPTAEAKEEDETVHESSESPETSYDPALQPLVSLVVEDLAQRLGIDPQQIEVLEAKVVVWPDASMGCPQPGMNYIQVPQDGVLIRLSAIGSVYDYHGDGMRELFLCYQTQIFRKSTPKIDEPDVPPPGDLID